jgi:hypothetical protein
MKNDVLKFQQECYENYLNDISKEVPEFPSNYCFPDGNFIQPILPVKITKRKIMFVGAFPSARFEFRNNLLIPIGNNLSPFGKEEYFDGQQVRKQVSREVLEKYFFSLLDVNADEHWITNLVKIYLMRKEHIKNCIQINPNIKYADVHRLFIKIAFASVNWFYKEVEICKPLLILTFSENVARVINQDFEITSKELLNGQIKTIKILGKEYKICHLPHPEIVRRNKEWKEYNSVILSDLSVKIKKIIN